MAAVYISASPLAAPSSGSSATALAIARATTAWGRSQTLSLADARDRAHALRKLLLDKIDTIEHRRQERATAGVGAAKLITLR